MDEIAGPIFGLLVFLAAIVGGGLWLTDSGLRIGTTSYQCVYWTPFEEKTLTKRATYPCPLFKDLTTPLAKG